MLDYYRLSADGRLLFGGRVDAGDARAERHAAALRRRWLRLFPSLADVTVPHVWGGRVAVTASRLPHLGTLGPGLWFAHGFNGQGVALANLAGALVAEAMAGRPGRFRLLADLPQRRIPGGRLFRRALTTLGTLWLQLQERF